MTDDQDIMRRKAYRRRKADRGPRVNDRLTGGGPVWSTEVGDWRTEVNVENLHPAVAGRMKRKDGGQ